MQQFYCPFYCPYNQSVDPYYRDMQGPPSTPPPGYTPQMPQSASQGTSVYAVDPGAIRFCLYKFTYIWPSKGKAFWAYLIYVGRTSVAGWKYQNGRWVYFGMDTKEIKSFTCS